MRINFKEKGHIYTVNGDIASVSVTELLKKHGLSPDYSGVNPTLLKAKAEYGTKIHKDLELVLNEKNYEPTTIEGEKFAEWVYNNIDCGVGEQLLAYDYKGMIIAGTADVMAIGKDGKYILADHKTTSVVHRESVSWQVSLLDYFARHLDNEKVNGKPIHWRPSDKLYCFHYVDETFEVVELERVPDSEIEKLLECEYKGEKYQRPALVVDEEIKNEVEAVESAIMELDIQRTALEEREKAIRDTLLNLMEEQGIKSWETDTFKITYVAPSDRIAIDSKKVKEKYPMVYNECQKLTSVKASLRITIKEADND